jgi:flotillin
MLSRISGNIISKRFYNIAPFTNSLNNFPNNNKKQTQIQTRCIVTEVAVASMVTAGWLATRYKVSGPNEYLVKTGIFIDGIYISKKTFWLPYQTLSKIYLEPASYHCVIEEAMSHERIAFNMPTVFTIGPEDELEALQRYSKLFQTTTPEDLKTKIIGIIQGEARVAAGKIKLDDLFNNRQEFKDALVKEINGELTQFGLKVYNANIEELKDLKGNEYFSKMKQKALEGATNQAKIAVAEQTKLGDVGEMEHKTETRQKIASYEKEARLAENERNKEIAESNAKLEIAKADFDRQQKIALAEAHASTEQRTAELQALVEEKKRVQEEQKLRASELARASVEAEMVIRIAEGKAEAVKREAEGRANAIRIEAEAKATATKLTAEADFVKMTNEAKGIIALRDAEAKGLQELIKSAGGIEGLNSYLMVRDNQIKDIAEHQANAVKGMEPNITVVTGQEGGVVNTMNQLMSAGMPILNNLKDKYGIDLLDKYRTKQ